MSQEERRPLLARAPLPSRQSSLPERALRDGNPFNVSPGGQSWTKRISEGGSATSPPARSPLAVAAPRTRTRTTSRVSESAEEGHAGETRSRLYSDRSRRPYHYASQVDLQGQPMAGTVSAGDPVEEAHYRRYQYYTRLQNQTGVNLDVLSMPEHVVPASFYQLQFLGVAPGSGKQSSIVTIFAIWNTMMGTSLLSMPWALQQAGLGMGLAMMVLVSGLCLYTAYRILQVYTVHSRTMKISEFGDLCGLLLGRWAELTATSFSVLAILGAAIVYWVLMSNFLFSTVVFIHDAAMGRNDTDADEGVYCPNNNTLGLGANTTLPAINTTDSTFSPVVPDTTMFDMVWGQFTTVPLFLTILVFPLINLKSATFFTKFNSLGTVSILFILTSVLYRCYEWGLNAEFTDVDSEQYIPLFRSSFPSLTGILALGLFIHNAIITIMTNNKHQENNGRDMSLAYMLVTGTYMLIGAAFYVAFPLPKRCIEDNLLNNFHKHDVLTVAAKIFLFFQMLTVFPLIMYILRVSVLYPVYRSVWPGLSHILVINSSTVVVCILFACFMPHIGTVIRFSGAACGMTIIFALPIMVHMASVKRTGELSWRSIILHSMIIMLGASNFVAQFFI